MMFDPFPPLSSSNSKKSVDPFEGFVCHLKQQLALGENTEEQKADNEMGPIAPSAPPVRWGQPPDFPSSMSAQNGVGIPKLISENNSTIPPSMDSIATSSSSIPWGQPPIFRNGFPPTPQIWMESLFQHNHAQIETQEKKGGCLEKTVENQDLMKWEEDKPEEPKKGAGFEVNDMRGQAIWQAEKFEETSSSAAAAFWNGWQTNGEGDAERNIIINYNFEQSLLILNSHLNSQSSSFGQQRRRRSNRSSIRSSDSKLKISSTLKAGMVEEATSSAAAITSSNGWRTKEEEEADAERSPNNNCNSNSQSPPFGQQRRRRRPRPMITFRSSDSDLRIWPKDVDDMAPIFHIAAEKIAHGYNTKNAAKALDRFIKRNLLNVVAPPEFMEAKDESDTLGSTYYIYRKLVNVPSVNAKRIQFEGRGINAREAEQNCNLDILNELYDFDLIKEANVEIYNPMRKDLRDPSRKLDQKTLAWLECSTDKFVQKMEQITAQKDLFY